MPTPSPVIQDPEARRFVIAHPEGDAELTYELNAGTLVIVHTFVPPSLRGQKIAETLSRSALTWATEANLRVIPQCSYIARFIARHSEFQRLLKTES